MTDPEDLITNLRQRITSSTEISDPDREHLITFSDRLDLLDSEYSDHRHAKLLNHCTIMAEETGGLARALKEREAAEDLVRWIKRQYDNEYTKKDFRVALRMFGEHATDGEGKPPSLEWVPTGTSNSHDPVPNPADMLEWEDDVRPMIEDGTRNARDAALIAVAFDAGLRSDELRSLTVGGVNDHRHGLQVMVDGKTGQRSVTLRRLQALNEREKPGQSSPSEKSCLISRTISTSSSSVRPSRVTLLAAFGTSGPCG